jgi:hypothetical protein
MRWSALLLVPLFLFACDREPAAPGIEPTLDLAPSMRAEAVTPGVQPRNAKPLGRTYEEWGGAMLQWVAAIPTATNPFLDEAGAFTQAHESGKVWFLMGPSEVLPQPQSAAITMPAGTSIVFSPLALYTSGPGGVTGDGDDTPEELRALAEWVVSLMTGVSATIDGVPVADIEQYRLLSPTVPLQVPVDNFWTDVFGYPNPWTFGILGGYVLFLNPLPPGVHILHAVSAVPDFGLAFDMTYTITVEPGR